MIGNTVIYSTTIFFRSLFFSLADKEKHENSHERHQSVPSWLFFLELPLLFRFYSKSQ